MGPKLTMAFNAEMEKALDLYRMDDFSTAFFYLERAHILGQSYVIPHTKAHWWMLKVGWKKHDMREVLGQVTRILASIVFSRIWVPLGNTGGANVNPMKPMPIPDDLKKILNEAS